MIMRKPWLSTNLTNGYTNLDKPEGDENQPEDEKSEDEETYEEERDRRQAYREHQFKFDSFELVCIFGT